jgi:hypothetical protein
VLRTFLRHPPDVSGMPAFVHIVFISRLAEIARTLANCASFSERMLIPKIQ